MTGNAKLKSSKLMPRFSEWAAQKSAETQKPLSIAARLVD